MCKIPLRIALRINKATIFSALFLIILSLAYKFGYRSKYEPWETSTSWADLINAFPEILLATVIAGLLFFVFAKR